MATFINDAHQQRNNYACSSVDGNAVRQGGGIGQRSRADVTVRDVTAAAVMVSTGAARIR
jgi:hypothetical protein